MQARNAASVLPEPVGAEMSVSSPGQDGGQPSICGSVGVPNLSMNHSRTSGWAHSRAVCAAIVGVDAEEVGKAPGTIIQV